MANQTHKRRPHSRTNLTAEYRFYMTIIFIAALPFATFFWFRDLVRGDVQALHHGIAGRAMTEASITTRKILSAL